MKARIPKHREFIINFPDSIDQNKANEGWAKLQQIVDVVGTFTESKRNGRHEASMGYSGGNLKRKVRMRRRRRILLLMRSCPGCQRRKSFQDNFQMLRA